MSRLPQLEAQLVAAAAGTPRPAAPWRPRIVLALVAAACAAAAFLAFAPRRDAAPVSVDAGVAPVPAQTVALSRALTAAPAPAFDPREVIPHAQLPGVAAELEAHTPYPPGAHDDFDWAATSPDPRSVASVNYRGEVQRLVEYRAYCLWLRYWLSAQGQEPELRSAAAVIADVPQWPTQRRPDDYARGIFAAVGRGDVVPVQREVDINCRGV